MNEITRKLSKELGYYLPNRLTINMGDYELPIEEGESEKFTLFLHEYVHLVQNVFTISGWESYSNELLNYVALTKMILHDKIIKYPLHGCPPGSIPADTEKIFDVADQYDDYVFEIDMRLNRCKNAEFLGKLDLVTVIPHGSKFKRLSEKPYVAADFSVDGTQYELKITPFILSESMSYMVENFYGIANLPAPTTYPYKIIGKIFEKTNLRDRPEFQIIIIHLSMMTSFPDIQFKKIFDYAVIHDLYKITSVQEFCDRLISDSSTRIKELINFNLNKIDTRMQQYEDALTIYGMADKHIRWIKDVYGAISTSLRSNPIWYLMPILNKGTADDILGVLDRNYFMFEQSDGKLSLHKRTEQNDIDAADALIFNRNLFHFLDYIIRKYEHNPRCPMYMNCKLIEKDSTCVDEPYKHGIRTKNEQICHYGQAAHLFGVNQYPIAKF